MRHSPKEKRHISQPECLKQKGSQGQDCQPGKCNENSCPVSLRGLPRKLQGKSIYCLFFLLISKFLFCEDAGLPEELLYEHEERCIRIPMIEEARSLNLSNSVAIVVYEALRQQGFDNLKDLGQLTKFHW